MIVTLGSPSILEKTTEAAHSDIDILVSIERIIMNPEKAREMGRNGRKFAETRDWKKTAAESTR